jgi:putative transposase
MPRIARLVCPGVPHHVTQRGNRRSQVFFSDADYRSYLSWLHFDAKRYGAEVLAYCLMSNHVHLVLVPHDKQSIEYILRHLHMRYAQRANRQNGWNGHLWQGRYFSSPLDEPHLWVALRYVELNPVRAGLSARAEDYNWSSALAHCNARSEPVLSRDPKWTRQLEAIDDWSSWLASGVDQSAVERIRRMTASGMACGSPQFVELLQSRTGRNLVRRPSGRPRRAPK